MSLRNTTTNYGNVARFLHWSMAALFVLAYCIIYGRNWFMDEDSSAGLSMLHLHQSVGISILVFVAIRIAWRLSGVQPQPLVSSRWMRLAGAVSHAALYFFMIAMPISGYLYTKKATVFFGLFEIPSFGETALAQWVTSASNLALAEGIQQPMKFFHREFAGEAVLLALVLLHVSAALYHHYVARDAVLLRMLPDRGIREGERLL